MLPIDVHLSFLHPSFISHYITALGLCTDTDKMYTKNFGKSKEPIPASAFSGDGKTPDLDRKKLDQYELLFNINTKPGASEIDMAAKAKSARVAANNQKLYEEQQARIVAAREQRQAKAGKKGGAPMPVLASAPEALVAAPEAAPAEVQATAEGA